MEQKILVVGAWHLGSVVGACIADVGHQVYLWDQSPQAGRAWCEGRTPIFEPGLEVLVARNWQKRLYWLEKSNPPSKNWDWIIISYDTPVDANDEIDLSIVEEGFEFALAQASQNTHFFLTAQVPVGTSRSFREKVQKKIPGWSGNFYYQPENLRLGDAIQSFMSPDRIVLGLDDLAGARREELLKGFYDLVGNLKPPLEVMSLESAEMVKHAMNSFLATCVVYANQISDLCERTGANAWDVVSSLKKDARVGPKAFLRPGLGFAGATLARDLQILKRVGRGLPAESFFSEIYRLNSQRHDWVRLKLEGELHQLEGKKIVLLGVTYKPHTSTVRRSPAVEIATLLKENRAHCVALDPQADFSEMTSHEQATLPFEFSKDPFLAFEGADACVLVTEWPEFRDWPWAELAKKMKTPFLLDSKNFLNIELGQIRKIIPGRVE